MKNMSIYGNRLKTSNLFVCVKLSFRIFGPLCLSFHVTPTDTYVCYVSCISGLSLKIYVLYIYIQKSYHSTTNHCCHLQRATHLLHSTSILRISPQKDSKNISQLAAGNKKSILLPMTKSYEIPSLKKSTTVILKIHGSDRIYLVSLLVIKFIC